MASIHEKCGWSSLKFHKALKFKPGHWSDKKSKPVKMLQILPLANPINVKVKMHLLVRNVSTCVALDEQYPKPKCGNLKVMQKYFEYGQWYIAYIITRLECGNVISFNVVCKLHLYYFVKFLSHNVIIRFSGGTCGIVRPEIKVCSHLPFFSPFYLKRAVLQCSYLPYFAPCFSPSFVCWHVLDKASFTPRGIVFIDLVFTGIFWSKDVPVFSVYFC